MDLTRYTLYPYTCCGEYDLININVYCLTCEKDVCEDINYKLAEIMPHIERHEMEKHS